VDSSHARDRLFISNYYKISHFEVYVIPYATWVLYSSEAAEVYNSLFQQLILQGDRCADCDQKLSSSAQGL